MAQQPYLRSGLLGLVIPTLKSLSSLAFDVWLSYCRFALIENHHTYARRADHARLGAGHVHNIQCKLVREGAITY